MEIVLFGDQISRRHEPTEDTTSIPCGIGNCILYKRLAKGLVIGLHLTENNMRHLFFIIVLMSLAQVAVFSQPDSLQRQINEQVWKPFIEAFNTGDDESFSNVHSKEIIRVIQDDNQIIGFEQYFKKIPDSAKAKWSSWKKNIELRFIQRIAGHDKAFEVGYYKTTSTNTRTGEKRTGIGKFYVLLRKENGVWKILMDADTGEGANEEVFKKASPIE